MELRVIADHLVHQAYPEPRERLAELGEVVSQDDEEKLDDQEATVTLDCGETREMQVLLEHPELLETEEMMV